MSCLPTLLTTCNLSVVLLKPLWEFQSSSKSLEVTLKTAATASVRLTFCFCFLILFSPIRDVISGLIMAATSIPQLIAYAETVGYAGHRGLATAGPPLAAWGMTTGGVYMNGGVTSVTALMAKSDLGGEAYVAEYGEEAYGK